MPRPELEIEPFGKRVIVERVIEDNEQDQILSSVTDDDGGQVVIYRPTNVANPNKEHTGIVKAVGAECEYVMEGDRVLFVRHLGDATFLDQNLLVMHESDIIGRIQDKLAVKCA
jgi:co-chaperonin GroES (HSP10)